MQLHICTFCSPVEVRSTIIIAKFCTAWNVASSKQAEVSLTVYYNLFHGCICSCPRTVIYKATKPSWIGGVNANENSYWFVKKRNIKQNCFIQLNLDYPDSLGLDEIAWIIEGLDNRRYEDTNINEEKNCLNKASPFNCETRLEQIVWKTIWSTVYLNHSTLSQSELIQVFFISYVMCECCYIYKLLFKSKTYWLLSALFNAIVLKRILPLILIMTNRYSWQIWDWKKGMDNRGSTVTFI